MWGKGAGGVEGLGHYGGGICEGHMGFGVEEGSVNEMRYERGLGARRIVSEGGCNEMWVCRRGAEGLVKGLVRGLGLGFDGNGSVQWIPGAGRRQGRTQ